MSKKNETAIAPDEALSKAEAFVTKHKVVFIAAIALIIIIAALNAFGVFSPRDNESQEANAAIANIEYKVFEQDFETALNGDGFNAGLLEIIEKYEETSAANKAHLYAGLIYAQKKDYESAISHLSQYNGSDNVVAAKVKQTLGNCYSQMGKEHYQTAINLVLEAANANNMAITPACLRDAAAMYEALGNNEEALKLYNRIYTEYPNSPIAREAEMKINASAK